MFWSTVKSLLASSRPTTVFGRIGTVIIDSIELMIGRWFSSHIGEKSLVNIPSRIKFDAAASVVLPIFIGWSSAAVSCARPRFPFGGAFSPIAMLGIRLANAIPHKASARLGSFILQIIGLNDSLISTVAMAKPACIAAAGIYKRKDNQTAKTLVDKIDDLVLTFWHSPSLTFGDCDVNAI